MQMDIIRILYQLYAVSKEGKIHEENDENKEMIKQLEDLLNIKLDWNKNTKNQLYKLIDAMYSLYDERDGNTLTEFYWFFKNEQLKFSDKGFDEIMEMDFETIKIPVMKNYDEVLKALYGDYMTPVRGTAAHNYPFYKKQQKLIEDVYAERKAEKSEVTIDEICESIIIY